MKNRVIAATVLAAALVAGCGSGGSDAPLFTPTSETPTATVTSEAPAVDGSIPGDGTFEVGVDVEPGTYKNGGADEEGDTCIAYASKSATPGTGSLRQSVNKGPGIITINSGEFFSTHFCQDWTKQ